MFGPETFIERVGDDALVLLAAAGDFAYVVSDEASGPRPHRGGAGGRSRQRDVGAAGGRRERPVVPRAANPGRPDMEVSRASKTMMRAVVVFVGRAI